MIKATFIKSNGSYISYEITGHAHYAEPGKDIVCAGVSTLLSRLLINYFVNRT